MHALLVGPEATNVGLRSPTCVCESRRPRRLPVLSLQPSWLVGCLACSKKEEAELSLRTRMHLRFLILPLKVSTKDIKELRLNFGLSACKREQRVPSSSLRTAVGKR